MTVGELPPHAHNASVDTQNLEGQFGTGNNSANFLYKYDTTGICSNKGSESVYNSIQNGNQEVDRTQLININVTHKHAVTISNTGSNTPHNNMQPYSVCNIWKRIS